MSHNQHLSVLSGVLVQVCSYVGDQYVLLRNSATVIAVATAALSDSEPGSSAGYGGMYNLSETSFSIAGEIPSDSFPITIITGFSRPVSNDVEYIFRPSRKVPYTFPPLSNMISETDGRST